MYITRDDILNTLVKMRKFEGDLNSTFKNHGFDLRENTGRRNQFLSVAQEKYLAHELSKKYKNVKVDGSTGQPDIVIEDIGKEIECKLTSGRGKYRSYELQTDYQTLKNKKKLDYLYILSDKDFSSFCVIFFEGLTCDDFYPPASGSRGKSRMNKVAAMKKSNFLFGSVKNRNTGIRKKIDEEIGEVISKRDKRLKNIDERMLKLSEKAIKTREKLSELRERERERYFNKLRTLVEKKIMWLRADPRYTFILEGLK